MNLGSIFMNCTSGGIELNCTQFRFFGIFGIGFDPLRQRQMNSNWNWYLCLFRLSKGLALPRSTHTGEMDIFYLLQFFQIPGSFDCFTPVWTMELHTFIEVMLLEIGFIGAGKVGKALGLYFKAHGLNLSGYCSRTEKSAIEAAVLTSSRAFRTLRELADSSDIIFITVPDQALAEVDREVALMLDGYEVKHETFWFHVSGAHSSDILQGIRKAGCETGSMHPLQSFGEPYGSAERLNRSWFTLEGTDKAVMAAKSLLDKTYGKHFLIKAENKPLYHAGASVVSNFMVTLIESGINLFEAAGMDRNDIFKAIEPLIGSTLSNIREKGTIDALTGPIVRGDYDTVRVHLKAIGEKMPSELEFYRAMAHRTAMMIDGNRLTHGQVEEFERILEVWTDGR